MSRCLHGLQVMYICCLIILNWPDYYRSKELHCVCWLIIFNCPDCYRSEELYYKFAKLALYAQKISVFLPNNQNKNFCVSFRIVYIFSKNSFKCLRESLLLLIYYHLLLLLPQWESSHYLIWNALTVLPLFIIQFKNKHALTLKFNDDPDVDMCWNVWWQVL